MCPGVASCSTTYSNHHSIPHSPNHYGTGGQIIDTVIEAPLAIPSKQEGGLTTALNIRWYTFWGSYTKEGRVFREGLNEPHSPYAMSLERPSEAISLDHQAYQAHLGLLEPAHQVGTSPKALTSYMTSLFSMDAHLLIDTFYLLPFTFYLSNLNFNKVRWWEWTGGWPPRPRGVEARIIEFNKGQFTCYP
jgi:hypothetical protein